MTVDANRQVIKKNQVHQYWSNKPCGSDTSNKKTQSKEYYDEIESVRYNMEPHIHEFAQFTRWYGKKVLEVGIGMGTDFLQWVRAGTEAYGVDLTEESIKRVAQRLDIYGLKARELRVADAEELPYDDNTFDVVYSWGVLHHTPDTGKALQEVVRVCRPGGSIKVMMYNRHSLVAWKTWWKNALMKARPWRSLAWCLAHHMESAGTKGYTIHELRNMFFDLPVMHVRIRPMWTNYDNLSWVGWRVNELLRRVVGDRGGWFVAIEATKNMEQLTEGT